MAHAQSLSLNLFKKLKKFNRTNFTLLADLEKKLILFSQFVQVMLAAGVTAVIVIALTVFAFQTKWDFTMMGGVLFVGLWLMIIFSFILMFWRSHVVDMIFCSFGALLFSAYLIRMYCFSHSHKQFNFIRKNLIKLYA